MSVEIKRPRAFFLGEFCLEDFSGVKKGDRSCHWPKADRICPEPPGARKFQLKLSRKNVQFFQV